jgi:hypothetical protein
MSARILKIGILEVGPVELPVVVRGGRYMEVPMLLAVRVSNDVAQLARIHALRPIFRIPHDFVNEIAQVQHESQPVLGRSLPVLPYHAPVGDRRTLLHVLAAHKSETHRRGVLIGRRRNRAADSAAKALLVGKAVPIDACGL